MENNSNKGHGISQRQSLGLTSFSRLFLPFTSRPGLRIVRYQGSIIDFRLDSDHARAREKGLSIHTSRAPGVSHIRRKHVFANKLASRGAWDAGFSWGGTIGLEVDTPKRLATTSQPSNSSFSDRQGTVPGCKPKMVLQIVTPVTVLTPNPRLS